MYKASLHIDLTGEKPVFPSEVYQVFSPDGLELRFSPNCVIKFELAPDAELWTWLEEVFALTASRCHREAKNLQRAKTAALETALESYRAGIFVGGADDADDSETDTTGA